MTFLYMLLPWLADATPALIHRDLQSTNVLVNRHQPAFIDFQGMRIGAAAYNAAHTYAAPALLAVASVGLGWTPGVPVALIWTAHIGLDRLLGYGLKQPDGFHQTHLGPIGPARHG